MFFRCLESAVDMESLLIMDSGRPLVEGVADGVWAVLDGEGECWRDLDGMRS